MKGVCKYCGGTDLIESDTARVNSHGFEQTFTIPNGLDKPISCKKCGRTQNMEAYLRTIKALAPLVKTRLPNAS